MKLDRFIAKSRIVELKSTEFSDALAELLDSCIVKKPTPLKKEIILQELLLREKTMTTNLGNGIALPHTRVPMTRPYLFAVGRCPEGLTFDGNEEYRDLRFVFLLLASEKENSYLNVLASLARIFQEEKFVTRLKKAHDLATFRNQITQNFGKVAQKKQGKGNKFNRLILQEAEKIAKGAKCSAILVFGDTFAGGIDLGNSFSNFKSIFVTQNVPELGKDYLEKKTCIAVRSFSNNRLSQLRSAVLIGLTRGIFKHNDRLCCIGGIPQSNQFDTLVIVDVEREFQSVITKEKDMLPSNVKPEIIERVLAIATELAIEGREGRPVGSLFVIGNTEQLNPYIKPLILNPFFGYKEEDRHILNPFMDETIKELSCLDGAFIIRGDGVIETAGSLIHGTDCSYNLPSGLGTRHAAACAISVATDSIAIVVSSSTGQVTLFRQGQLFPLIEKGIGRNL